MRKTIKEWVQYTPAYIQVALLLISVVFISLLFPNHGQFRYQYSIGKTWKYEDLFAPYDFSIRKSQQEIDQSVKIISDNFIPYFYRDTTVYRRSIEFLGSQLTSFVMDFGKDSINSEYQAIGDLQNKAFAMLRRTYDQGILLYQLDQMNKDSLPKLYLSENGTIQLRRSNTFLTLQDARDRLVDLLENYEPKVQYINTLRNVFEQSVDPNILYDAALSKKFLNQELGKISMALGKLSKGDLIIRKGSVIDKEAFQALVSLEERYLMDAVDGQSFWHIYLGHFLFALLILSLFFLYLNFKYRSVLTNLVKLLFFLVWFWIYAYLVYAVEENASMSVYMIPFCIVPIVIKNFFDEGIAFITLILLVLLTSFISSPGLDFAFIMILGGLVAILIETETRYWARYFYSILLVVAALFVGYFCISMIKEGTLYDVNWRNYNWLLINGVLTLLSYPLIPLLERIFGFTSAITLAELNDLNKPLLKKLSIKAPGTFQHSIQVGNLAEAAAIKIGANSLQVKVGALYHDIGKMNNPAYFIENSLDQSMLHDKLDCKESAQIIINHVTDGIQIARQNKLPSVIIDFIRTHHGTTRVEYFYRKHLEGCTAGDENPELFTYPGPRPRTKEQTIVMLADSVEAASKATQFESEQDIDDFVDRIIQFKLNAHQLEHSDLTFEELEMCKKVFKKMLKSIHHVRIAYPKQPD